MANAAIQVETIATATRAIGERACGARSGAARSDHVHRRRWEHAVLFTNTAIYDAIGRTVAIAGIALRDVLQRPGARRSADA